MNDGVYIKDGKKTGYIAPRQALYIVDVFNKSYDSVMSSFTYPPGSAKWNQLKSIEYKNGQLILHFPTFDIIRDRSIFVEIKNQLAALDLMKPELEQELNLKRPGKG